MVDQRGRYAWLCQEDPDLLNGLDEAAAELAEAKVRVPVLKLLPGLDPTFVEPGDEPPLFGMIVLDGLLVRRVGLGARATIEPLAAGDPIEPWQVEEDLSLAVGVGWEVCEPTRIAVLHADLAAHLARWPELAAALRDRWRRRANRLALLRAIAQLPQAERRLLCVLWHLADRWGQVRPEGRWLPRCAGQRPLAQLVGLRRSSISKGEGQLIEEGLVEKHSDGYLLLGHPPEDLNQPLDELPLDRKGDPPRLSRFRRTG